MAKNKKKKKKRSFDVADVRHHGTELLLPDGMSIPGAIDLLQRRQTHDEAEVVLNEVFDVFPWDGAFALNYVLEEMFGFAEGVWTPSKGFFNPPQPPQMISVKVGVNETKNVPWGNMRLPNDLGYIETGYVKKEGRFRFSLQATTERRNEPMIKQITGRMHERLRTHSIYRGKALAVRFLDERGKPLEMPEPEFMDTNVDIGSLTFSRDVEMSVATSLFTPLIRLDDLVANDIPIKRGILLGGPYGTGKTMTAKVASRLAVENGITFIYVRRTSELAHVIQFAKPYCDRAVVVF
jgi:transitional endoplasmic reticulum ATPase